MFPFEEPPPSRPFQTPPLCLPLPVLTFSSSLALTYLSPTALSIFGPPPPGADAHYFFQSGPPVLPELPPAGDLNWGLGRKLARLAEEHQELSWGQGTPLEYWTGTGTARKPSRCEAVVTLSPPPPSSSSTSPFHTDAGAAYAPTITIFFLRDLLLPSAPRHISLAGAGAPVTHKSVLLEGETELSHAHSELTKILSSAERKKSLGEADCGRIIDLLPQVRPLPASLNSS